MNENTKHQILVGAFAVAIGSLFYAMEVCA
jgi:hypothetical protein